MDEKPSNEHIRDLDRKQSFIGRPKQWDECGIEEKVERLRNELRGMRWAINRANDQAHHFEDHQHDALGNIVVPLRCKYAGGKEASTQDTLA